MFVAPPGLVRAFAPWQTLYANSKTLETSVTFVHLAALLFGGGFAVAADRRTLRTRVGEGEREAVLAELRATHGPVLVALGLLFVSGLALAAADVETFLASPIFVVKLAIVALLLANGGLLVGTERRLRRPAADGGPRPRSDRLWRRLRATSWASLALWTAVVLVGTMLVNAA